MSEQNRTTTEREQVEIPLAFAVNDKGLPEPVFKLRKRLYIKAKQEPRFRFYTLYDRIMRPDVLRGAWDLVAANDGGPGVDGVRIEDIENAPGGVERFLDELHETLKQKSYHPQPVRLQQRMRRHLKRRSQRPYRPPKGVTWYAHLYKRLGLVQL